MSKEIILPRQDEEGNYYISYSQIKLWQDLKSFNLGILGKCEYILSYFFGEDWPDAGWAAFGSDVEAYITEREKAETFDDREKKILESIETLGVFQQEVKIQFDGFYLKGFIDDMTKDMVYIRDYKTASENSAKKYYKPEYRQLHNYSLWILQETGKLPEKAEVCIVERKGNVFRTPGRENLSVGERVWYHTIDITMEEVEKERENIIQAVQEISDCYKVFLKLNS